MTTSTDINADSLEAFIAGLTASYKQPEFTTQTLVKVERKPRAAKAHTARKSSQLLAETAPAVVAPTIASPVNAAPPPVVAQLPTAGTLSAKEYFVAMRRATDRDARIAAIAGYIGYNRAEMYSPQELAANLQARKVLTPPKASPAVSGAAVSLVGYVKGVPDMKGKKLADLQGREVAAVEAMLSHRKVAVELLSQGNQIEAAHEANLAKLESDRLTQIRKDIESL